MKRCPECRRDYFDDSLLYCLDDGTRLLEGPGSGDSAATMLLPSFQELHESATRIFAPEGLTAAKATKNAIAVLPFLNLSAVENSDYFSDGLTEELLNVLSKIRGLRVAARTSAFSFKGKQTTVGEIGRILNVSSLLEGSVRHASDRVRISVRLTKVEDGYHLWSETYDRTMEDIFAVQDDIAQSVVEGLRTSLIGEDAGPQLNEQIVSEVKDAVKGRSGNAEAYRLMLMGRYFLDRTTIEDTARAIGYFNDALQIDPQFALCWAELGRAYSVEAGRGWAPVREAFERSREAVMRALSLEPELAEGHAQLGRIQAVHDWDLRSAQASYKKALELAPGSSSVLDGASVLAYKLGRFDEALELSRRVLAQDPLSAAFWHNLGLTCHVAELLEDAEKAYRKALEIASRRIVSNAQLALVLLDQGRLGEVIEQAEKEPDEFWRTWAMAIIHHAIGSKKESDDALAKLTNDYPVGNSYQIAEIFSMRGEVNEAFGWLEKAIEERDPGVTHAKVNPRFRALRDDSRWTELLSKVGL